MYMAQATACFLRGLCLFTTMAITGAEKARWMSLPENFEPGTRP